VQDRRRPVGPAARGEESEVRDEVNTEIELTPDPLSLTPDS
jgi:hypothetical protein